MAAFVCYNRVEPEKSKIFTICLFTEKVFFLSFDLEDFEAPSPVF